MIKYPVSILTNEQQRKSPTRLKNFRFARAIFMPGTTQIRLGRNPAGKVGCKMGKGAGGSISDCVKPVVKKKDRLLNCKKGGRDTQNRCLE